MIVYKFIDIKSMESVKRLMGHEVFGHRITTTVVEALSHTFTVLHGVKLGFVYPRTRVSQRGLRQSLSPASASQKADVNLDTVMISTFWHT